MSKPKPDTSEGDSKSVGTSPATSPSSDILIPKSSTKKKKKILRNTSESEDSSSTSSDDAPANVSPGSGSPHGDRKRKKKAPKSRKLVDTTSSDASSPKEGGDLQKRQLELSGVQNVNLDDDAKQPRIKSPRDGAPGSGQVPSPRMAQSTSATGDEDKKGSKKTPKQTKKSTGTDVQERDVRDPTPEEERPRKQIVSSAEIQEGSGRSTPSKKAKSAKNTETPSRDSLSHSLADSSGSTASSSSRHKAHKQAIAKSHDVLSDSAVLSSTPVSSSSSPPLSRAQGSATMVHSASSPSQASPLTQDNSDSSSESNSPSPARSKKSAKLSKSSGDLSHINIKASASPPLSRELEGSGSSRGEHATPSKRQRDKSKGEAASPDRRGGLGSQRMVTPAPGQRSRSPSPTPTAVAAALHMSIDVEPHRTASATLLLDVLRSPKHVDLLHEHMKKELCEENLDYWLETERLKNRFKLLKVQLPGPATVLDPQTILHEGRSIFQTFLDTGAPRSINLPAKMLARLKHAFKAKECSFAITDTLFNESQDSIFTLIEGDPFPRFLKAAGPAATAGLLQLGTTLPSTDFDEFLSSLDDTKVKWSKVSDDDGIKIQKYESHGVLHIKVALTVPASVFDAAHCIARSDQWGTWYRPGASVIDLEYVNDFYSVQYMSLPPSVKSSDASDSNRHFVYVLGQLHESEQSLVVFKSIPCSTAPQMTPTTRLTALVSGWRISPVPGSSPSQPKSNIVHCFRMPKNEVKKADKLAQAQFDAFNMLRVRLTPQPSSSSPH